MANPVFLDERWGATLYDGYVKYEFDVVVLDPYEGVEHTHHCYLQTRLSRVGFSSYRECIDSDGYQHPHISSDGAICVELMGEVIALWDDGHGDAALETLRHGLTKYNPDDSYNNYNAQQYCPRCDGRMYEDESYYCDRCGTQVCGGCCNYISGENYCYSCITGVCAICGERHERVPCSDCDRWVCSVCSYEIYDSHVCTECAVQCECCSTLMDRRDLNGCTECGSLQCSDCKEWNGLCTTCIQKQEERDGDQEKSQPEEDSPPPDQSIPF